MSSSFISLLEGGLEAAKKASVNAVIQCLPAQNTKDALQSVCEACNASDASLIQDKQHVWSVCP